MEPRRILILGGTAEARTLAGLLLADVRFTAMSSLAGRVSNPTLPPGDTRVGGFGGASGLRDWLANNHIDAVVDATHPFASRITDIAVAAASEIGKPLVVLRRPQWEPVPADNWHDVPDIAGAAAWLTAHAAPRRIRRAFLTTGRQDVGAFSHVARWWFLIRVVDPPSGRLPPMRAVIASRGPYVVAEEEALMRKNKIGILVTKNSGGDLVSAKLAAARNLAIPVVMVRRPSLPAELGSRPDIVVVPTAHAAHAALVEV